MPIEIQAVDSGAIYTITGWRNAWRILFYGGFRFRVVIEGLGPNPKITSDPAITIKDINGEIVQEGRR